MNPPRAAVEISIRRWQAWMENRGIVGSLIEDEQMLRSASWATLPALPAPPADAVLSTSFDLGSKPLPQRPSLPGDEPIGDAEAEGARSRAHTIADVPVGTGGAAAPTTPTSVVEFADDSCAGGDTDDEDDGALDGAAPLVTVDRPASAPQPAVPDDVAAVPVSNPPPALVVTASSTPGAGSPAAGVSPATSSARVPVRRVPSHFRTWFTMGATMPHHWCSVLIVIGKVLDCWLCVDRVGLGRAAVGVVRARLGRSRWRRSALAVDALPGAVGVGGHWHGRRDAVGPSGAGRLDFGAAAASQDPAA